MLLGMSNEFDFVDFGLSKLGPIRVSIIIIGE
jgi:hypothetical protein